MCTKKIFNFCISIIESMLLTLTACTTEKSGTKTTKQTETITETTAESSWMQIDILDVGKADAIVIQTQSHAVEIDCGEKDNGMDVVTFLQDNHVETLDDLIITHNDQDHVGGAAKVIRKVGVQTVIAPNYIENSSEYEKYTTAMSDTGITPILLMKNMTFTLDDVVFTVYASHPENYTENKDNNSSLVVWIEHGENTFLFMGDAMEERITELMQQEDIGTCTFLKVSYHGRTIENLTSFFEFVQPSTAVISSKASEISESTVNTLAAVGAEVYSTVENGRVTVISDGNSITVQTEK